MTIVYRNLNQDKHTQPVERSNENDHVSVDAPVNSNTEKLKIFSEMIVLQDMAIANISSSTPYVARPFFP